MDEEGTKKSPASSCQLIAPYCSIESPSTKPRSFLKVAKCLAKRKQKSPICYSFDLGLEIITIMFSAQPDRLE